MQFLNFLTFSCALLSLSTSLPLYQSSFSAFQFPHSVGGNRYGNGYIGNPGIGIKQTDANLADLYGLPRQLAQLPAPRPFNAPAPVTPFSPLSSMHLAPANAPLNNMNVNYYNQAAAAINLGLL